MQEKLQNAGQKMQRIIRPFADHAADKQEDNHQNSSQDMAPRSLNDGDMRDLVLSLISRSNINFSNVYLKPTDGEIQSRPALATWDGLIMRPEGYFRVAKEPETGVKVILFEFEPRHLSGAYDEDGDIKLSNLDQASTPDSPDIYRVGAFDPTTDHTVLQDAIDAFCKNLRNNIVPQLDLYLRDEADQCDDKRAINRHTFRAANQDVAFGLYKSAEERWESVMYSSMRGNHDESGQFERIPERERQRGRSKKTEIFRMNTENMTEAESFGGVLRHTLQYWGINSLKKFKGKQPLSEAMTLKMVFKRKGLRGKADYGRVYARQQYRRSVRGISGFIGKRYKEYGLSALVGLVLSSQAFKLGAAKAVLVAVATAVGGTFFSKFIDEQTQKGISTFFANRAQYNEMKNQLPQNRDYSRFFDAKSRENDVRPLKKIAPAFVNRLVLLNHAESGVMHSMDKTSAVTRRDWKEQYLGGLETRMFGKANMAACGNSVLKILPNGVVSLTHINREFNVVSKYYTYNEAFVSSKAAPLHPAIQDDLAKGVTKLFDDRNRAGLSRKKMRRSDFTKELRKLYGEVQDIHGETTELPRILSQIFNPNAKGCPHDRVAEALSEAACVSYTYDEDPLETLMNLSKELRDQKDQAAKDQKKIAQGESPQKPAPL